MKSMNKTFLVFLFVSLNIWGCVQTHYDVDIPRAASRKLDVRSGQYDKTMALNPLVDGENNQQYGQPPNTFPAVNTFMSTSPDVPETHPSRKNSEECRMALVIGNSNYTRGGNLPNPVNDANAMSSVLRKLHFNVTKYVNANQKEMKRAIDVFGRRLQGCDVGLFFYAGHGVQVHGNNYLIPVDADLSTENDVEYNCVHAGRILSKMEDASSKTNIIILDACRDNPFARSWTRSLNQHGKGLAFMNAPSGSLIAYSTSPGSTALDGVAGQNGVYTAALIRYMQTPNITIEEMFKRTRVAVEKQTNKRQTPWESTSLKGDFFFKIVQ